MVREEAQAGGEEKEKDAKVEREVEERAGS